MNFEELDLALEELELRLERLRSLYEQYFLGFEKIEPSVARKDVDRRIYLLRREKIRNTGKRFKMQTIIQRYNTYQQYWQRICREIENGTYKRHVLRAERLMGPEQLLTIAARRRFGKAAGERLAAEADVADEALPVEHESTEPGHGSDPAPLPAIPRAATFVPAAAKRTEPPSTRPRSSGPPKYESLELDMDFLDSWDPGTQVRAKAEPKSDPKAAPPPKPKGAPEAAPPPKPLASRLAPPPKPLASRVAPPPKPAIPARPAPPAAPAPARPAERPAAAAGSGLSDDRIKELHAKLVQTKRDNRETGQVSVESLAKTLRAAEEKLRVEHKNRRIEFEVVLRDGKAVVKPKVR